MVLEVLELRAFGASWASRIAELLLVQCTGEGHLGTSRDMAPRPSVARSRPVEAGRPGSLAAGRSRYQVSKVDFSPKGLLASLLGASNKGHRY